MKKFIMITLTFFLFLSCENSKGPTGPRGEPGESFNIKEITGVIKIGDYDSERECFIIYPGIDLENRIFQFYIRLDSSYEWMIPTYVFQNSRILLLYFYGIDVIDEFEIWISDFSGWEYKIIIAGS